MPGAFLLKRALVVGFLFFLLLILLTFYLFSQAKSYSYEIEFLLTKSTSALTTFKKKKATSGLKLFQQLKTDAEKVKQTLNSRVTPKGAEQLKWRALEYVGIVEEVAVRGIQAYQYLAKISNDIKNLRQALKETEKVSEPNAKAKIVAKASGIIAIRFRSLEPPVYLKPTHTKLTKALEQLAEKSKAVAEAGEAGNYIAVSVMLAEWQESGRLVDALFQASIDEAAQQILPPAKKLQLKKLAEAIDLDIVRLQKGRQLKSTIFNIWL